MKEPKTIWYYFAILVNIIIFINVPFIFTDLLGSIVKILSFFLILILLGLVCLKSKMNIDSWIKIIICVFFSMFIYGILIYLKKDSLVGFRKFFGYTFKLLYLISLSVIIKHAYKSVINLFFKLNIDVLLLSLTLFVIILFGINLPYFTFLKLDGREHYFYWIGATNSFQDIIGFNVIRIAGFADEPGAFALILSYLLVINEFTYCSNRYRILITIGGIFTFSIAFIITLIIMIIYWFQKRILSAKNTLIISIPIFLLIIVVSITSYSTISQTIFQKLLFSRFEIADDGSMRGDNRSFAIPMHWKLFTENPILGVAPDTNELEKYYIGYPNPLTYLAQYGIYGQILFYLPFFFLVYRYRHKKCHLLFIALAINYLQRPGIEDMFALTSLTLIYYSYKFQSQNVSKNICNNRNVQC